MTARNWWKPQFTRELHECGGNVGSVIRPRLVALASIAMVALIGVADFITGYEIRLAILYLIPIALATWRIGARAGYVTAAAAMLCWFISFDSNHPYTHDLYFYWEGGISTATFVVIVLLLGRLRRALEHSDERFVTVLEHLDDAVQVQDPRTGAPLFDNRRFREVFGSARAITEESGEIHHQGSWHALRSRPLRWTDGRPAVLRVLSDITEARHARELLEKHREEAHRTSRLVALGEFASAIAHELNQPLAAIATYNNACLMLLEKGNYSQAELAEAMGKCRDQARRAGAIIQRLREVLRQPVAARSAQDLNEVARTALALAEPHAQAMGVTVELELAPALPRVRTDRLLVEQVALNLVRNAIEAVQDLAPERRRVAISTAAQPGGVTFTVTDQGPGVPAELRERLFEAFVTTKPTGLGLGLSICRSVIESLGGSIRSTFDGRTQGARFAFTLPVEPA